jgi:peptide/nickel transport system permease protein
VKAPLFLLLAIAAASFAAPLLGAVLGIDPNMVDLLDRLSGPSLIHPLGTDELGRDVLLRLLGGGRVSLIIGVAAALAAAALGTLIGLLAGYLGGWADRVLMRGTDAIIALPLLPLLIVLAALDLHKLGLSESVIQSDEISVVRIVALAVLVGWTTAARLVRGATLVTRNRDFVRAARSLGAGVPHILWLHILPNVLGPLIVATTLSVGDVILFESVQHAEQCPGADRHGPDAGGLPRAADLPDRGRLQSAGRPFAAAARSGGGEQALIDKEKPPREARR